MGKFILVPEEITWFIIRNTWAKVALALWLSGACLFFWFWWSARITPAVIQSFPLDELRSVNIFHKGKRAPIDSNHWPELIRQLDQMKPTSVLCWKGETQAELGYLSFEWGEYGNFGFRFYTCPSLDGLIIGSLRKEGGLGSFHFDDYASNDLRNWLANRIDRLE